MNCKVTLSALLLVSVAATDSTNVDAKEMQTGQQGVTPSGSQGAYQQYMTKYADRYMSGQQMSGEQGSQGGSQGGYQHYMNQYADKYMGSKQGGMHGNHQGSQGGSQGDYQHYMNQYAGMYMGGKQGGMRGNQQGSQAGSQGDYQQYMNQYAGKYMGGQQGSTDAAAPVSLAALQGGKQGSRQGTQGDYQQYMTKYASKYMGNGGGQGDYQQYMSQGGQANFSDYYKQYQHSNQSQNLTSKEQSAKYVNQYASKYLPEGANFSNQTQMQEAFKAKYASGYSKYAAQYGSKYMQGDHNKKGGDAASPVSLAGGFDYSQFMGKGSQANFSDYYKQYQHINQSQNLTSKEQSASYVNQYASKYLPDGANFSDQTQMHEAFKAKYASQYAKYAKEYKSDYADKYKKQYNQTGAKYAAQYKAEYADKYKTQYEVKEKETPSAEKEEKSGADTAESKPTASKQLRSALVAPQSEAVGLAADAQPQAVPVAMLFAATFIPALAAGAMLVRFCRRVSDEAGLREPLQADASSNYEPLLA